MDVPPSQQPQYVVPKQGAGCCGGGCVALLVIAFLGLAAVIGGGWYLVHKAIDTFTSTEPANVAIAMPSDAEFAAANEKLEQLHTALRSQQGATFTFTAAELNALVARHPDFAARKGKMRFAIADSIATVEMSVPLSTLDWSRLRRRWFNGSANFGFIYADEGFRFDLNWLEANGHRLSGGILRYGTDAFNRSFSRGFDDSVEKEGSSELWRNVKTMTLDEDKLVIITRGS